jgi:DNA polymerase-4
VSAFCRDCLADAFAQATRCAACGSPRMVRHDELAKLSIAHIDCDAFYATIEKRDDPTLAAEPVIVGGARPCQCSRRYGFARTRAWCGRTLRNMRASGARCGR